MGEIMAHGHMQADAESTGDWLQLQSCINRLRELCASHQFRAPNWSALCRFELSEFADVLAAHLEREEQGGYFFDLVAQRPELKSRVERLLAEHRSLLFALDAARAILRAGASAAVAAPQVLALCDAVFRHEHEETTLVQTAVNTDIGLGD